MRGAARGANLVDQLPNRLIVFGEREKEEQLAYA
jgi:hypothetical protein